MIPGSDVHGTVPDMVSALVPIGSYPSTIRAVNTVLDRTQHRLEGTLAATLAHPTVLHYLEGFDAAEHGSIDEKPYSVFAGVLMPLLYGPHMDRSLRFFPPEVVEPLAYARSIAITQGLVRALEQERAGANIAHYGALQWIASCAREIGHLPCFDHFVIHFYDRHVHGSDDRGHDRVERILGDRERIAERSAQLYTELIDRSEHVSPRAQARRSASAGSYAGFAND